MIGSPLLLLFANEYAETIVVGPGEHLRDPYADELRLLSPHIELERLMSAAVGESNITSPHVEYEVIYVSCVYDEAIFQSHVEGERLRIPEAESEET